MRLSLRALLVGFVLFSRPGFAQELYRWVDEKGVIHFATEFQAIPEKYRQKVDAIDFPRPAQSPSSPPVRSPGLQWQPGQAQPAPRPQEIVVPFIREGNHIIVEGTVNGRGPVKFMLDTGADFSTIPVSRAADLQIDLGRQTAILTFAIGIGGIAPFLLVGIDSLKVGSAEVKNLDLMVGLSGDWGLLGADFLSGFHVDIQYSQNRVILRPVPIGPYDGHSAEWWRHKFRGYYAARRVLETLANKLDQSRQNENVRHMIYQNLEAVNKKINDLDVKATRTGVPHEFRK
jgi:hypothetical protein